MTESEERDSFDGHRVDSSNPLEVNLLCLSFANCSVMCASLFSHSIQMIDNQKASPGDTDFDYEKPANALRFQAKPPSDGEEDRRAFSNHQAPVNIERSLPSLPSVSAMTPPAGNVLTTDKMLGVGLAT